MDYKITIHTRIDCTEDEIIGVKEQIFEALDFIGCDVGYIHVEVER